MAACCVCNKGFDGRSNPTTCKSCKCNAHLGCGSYRTVGKKPSVGPKKSDFVCNKCALDQGEVMSAPDNEPASKADMQNILTQIQSMREAIERDFNCRFDKLENELVVPRLEKMETNITNIKKDINWLADSVNHHAEYSRRNTIEFHGVPIKQNETPKDVVDIVCNIAKILKVELSPIHIDAAHRLPSRSAVKPIIVKLVNRWKKDEIMKARIPIMAKDLGFHSSPLRVYINENLTPAKKYLAKKTRLHFKDCNCSVWTQNGKIFVAKKMTRQMRQELDFDDTTKKYLVESEMDFADIYDKLGLDTNEVS